MLRFAFTLGLVACAAKQPANGDAGDAATGDDAAVDAAITGFGSADAGTTPELTGTIYFIPDTTQTFPDVTQLAPQGTLYTPLLDVPPQSWTTPITSDRVEWFAIRYVGAFLASSDGMYKFRLLSDDGALLYIDGTKVVDNDGLHSVLEQSASVMLTAGAHPIQVDYFQGPRYFLALQLWLTPPGGTEDFLQAGM